MTTTLTDGCKRNIEFPESFPIPEPEEKERLHPGTHVKLMFETPDQAERMWVLITSRKGSKLEGTLCNEPFLLDHELAYGDQVQFSLDNVIDIHQS